MTSQANPVDEELWHQFLTVLNSDGSSDLNKILDTDDANDDPDFIVATENYLDEVHDTDDERIQVPKSETVALVKDTFEFCSDVVPISISSDENRFHKSKSNLSSILRRNTNESFDSELMFGLTSAKSGGREKRLRFSDTSSLHNDVERSLYGSTSSAAAAATAESNASELFDYFNQSGSSAAVVIASYSDSPSTFAGSSAVFMGASKSTPSESGKSTAEGSSDPKTSDAAATACEPKSPSKAADSEDEYIPELTDQQRKVLDEQLRNHVQLLTQTCLANYPIEENKQIFNDAFGLLKILDQLSNSGWDQEEAQKESTEEQASASQPPAKASEREASGRFFLSPDFKIVNLREALQIVNNVAVMDRSELASQNGIPSKFLEIIVNSPVFYNTHLIPKCRYNYQSQYKRSQFFDSEKILLIMGYNKFKHLSKKECCQCIRDHLLPHRSTADIKKQLNNISNSEQRQLHLKELMDKQKEESDASRSADFSVEVNYKSPLDQSSRVQLPSMYTLEVERSKMSHLLKDARENLGIPLYKPKPTKTKAPEPTPHPETEQLVEIIDENTSDPEPRAASSSDSDDSIQELNAHREASVLEKGETDSDDDNNDDEEEEEEDVTITFSKSFKRPIYQRSSSPSPTATGSASKKKSTAILTSILDASPQVTRHRVPFNSPVAPPRPAAANASKVQITKVVPGSSARASAELLAQSPLVLPLQGVGAPIILPDCSNPFAGIGQLVRSICVDSAGNKYLMHAQPQPPRQPLVKQSNQILTTNTNAGQQQQQQQQPSIMIPQNFAGTILFQPTIHVHMSARSSQENELRRYRQIVPKGGSPGAGLSTPKQRGQKK